MPRSGSRADRKYSDEFKLTAVRLSHQPGLQVKTVAAVLEIHPFMLSKWRKDARDGLIRGRAPKAPPPGPRREIAAHRTSPLGATRPTNAHYIAVTGATSPRRSTEANELPRNRHDGDPRPLPMGQVVNRIVGRAMGVALRLAARPTQVRQDILDFIERWCKRERQHSCLAMRAPRGSRFASRTRRTQREPRVRQIEFSIRPARA